MLDEGEEAGDATEELKDENTNHSVIAKKPVRRENRFLKPQAQI